METIKKNAAGKTTHILVVDQFIEKDKYSPSNHLLRQIEVDINFYIEEWAKPDLNEAANEVDRIEAQNKLSNMKDALELIISCYK